MRRRVGARERQGSGAGADVAAVTVSAANWMTSKSMIGTRVTRRNEVATVAASSCVPCIRPRRTICELLNEDIFPSDRLAPSLVPSDHAMGCHTGKRE